jgi:hypothetical protein
MHETGTPSNHKQWLGNEGFALLTDVSHQAMDNLTHTPLPELPSLSEIRNDSNARGIPGCDLALWTLAGNMYKYSGLRNGDVDTFDAQFGITQQDRERAINSGAFGAGLGEKYFPVMFSAFVATRVANQFLKDGMLSISNRLEFTLKDWANIIGSGWFSDLVHDLALAQNGQYGTQGASLSPYHDPLYFRKLENIKDTVPIFESDFAYEPFEDRTHVIAKLTTAARRQLRTGMQTQNSVGCPVARHATTLPREALSTNPHVKRLIKAGRLMVNPQIDPKSDRVVVQQEESAIDELLVVIAAKLDEYQNNYGNPVFFEEANYNRLKTTHSTGEHTSTLPLTFPGNIVEELKALHGAETKTAL